MADNPALIVRVAADISALKANLQQGSDTIDVLSGSWEKMAVQFTSRSDQMIVKAQAMVAAVQSIGGAQNLTEADQQRVNRTLEQAIAYYDQLGKQAPAGMRELAEATKQVEPPTNLLAGAIGMLAGYFTGRAVLQFADDVMMAGTRLEAFHERTGISIEALQRLDIIAQQNGATLDQVSLAVFQMGKRLAGDDKSATSAANELGLSFSSLKAMAPEDAFNIIGEAIGKLPDPMKQSELGAQLFGRSVQDLIPVFKHLSDDTGPYVALSAEQAAWLKDISDAYVRVKASIIPATVAWADQALGLSALSSVMRTLRADLGDGPAGLAGALSSVPPVVARVNTGLGLMSGEAATAALKDKELADRASGLTEQLELGAEADKKAAAAIAAHQAALKQLNDEIYINEYWTGKEGAALQDVTYNGFRKATEADFDLTEGVRDLSGVINSTAIPAFVNTTGTLLQVYQAHVSLESELHSLSGAFGTLAQIAGDSMGSVLRDIGSVIAGIDTALKAIGTFSSVWSTVSKYLGGSSGGGSAAASAGSSAAELGMSAAGIGGSIALGAATMGIGTGVALLAAYLASPDEEQRVVNPERSAYFSAHGGYEGINPAVYSATGSLDLVVALNNAKTDAQYQAAIAAISSAVPGFALGTGGTFVDFGVGTAAMLHGRERVVTEEEGRRESVSTARMEALLERQERTLRNLPQLLSLAVRDAIAVA